MAVQAEIITNVTDRLSALSVTFDDPENGDLELALKDALREMGISPSAIETSIAEGSELQFYVEVRAEYWAIHRIRNGQSLNFKYSTGIEGRSVDKTAIVRQLTTTMGDLDRLWTTWFNDTYRPSTAKSSGTGNLLNIPRRSSTLLAGDS